MYGDRDGVGKPAVYVSFARIAGLAQRWTGSRRPNRDASSSLSAEPTHEYACLAEVEQNAAAPPPRHRAQVSRLLRNPFPPASQRATRRLYPAAPLPNSTARRRAAAGGSRKAAVASRNIHMRAGWRGLSGQSRTDHPRSAAQTAGGPILEKGDRGSALIQSRLLSLQLAAYRAEYGWAPSCCRTLVTQILFFLPSIVGLLVD